MRGGTETEPALHPSAIADLLQDSKGILRSHMVENVLMPLHDEGAEPDAAKEATVPPVRVALALHTRRFDVEREEWFIDTGLDAPMAPVRICRKYQCGFCGDVLRVASTPRGGGLDETVVDT